jgi:pimeloyl-ACP methyl ester carboxylesterase
MRTTARSARTFSALVTSALLVLLGVAGGVVASPAAATAEVEIRRIEGALPDGTPWLIAVPSNWKGTLLLDLDFTTGQAGYQPLYERGFAGAGISRSGAAGDAQRTATQLVQVLDEFTARVGEPDFVLGNGRSRGGVASAVLMETYPERVDGAVAHCTVPGYVPYSNSQLDAAFTARTLLGSDLPVVDLPADPTAFTALTTQWRDLLSAAQGTPEGRARIALAIALGQLPTWSVPSTPEPDPKNTGAVQQAMFDTLLGQFYPGGGNSFRLRQAYEQAVGGVWNWNTGVDYERIWRKNVRPEQRKVVLELYRGAGLDLRADLKELNAAPRITADPAAVAGVQVRGGHTADPERPILFNQVIGDATTHVSVLESYLDRARKNGKGHLVRAVFVDNAGHCAFSPASHAAAVEVVDERVRSGHWPGTSPHRMNERARAIDPTAEPEFTAYRLTKFARPFFIGDTLP